MADYIIVTDTSNYRIVKRLASDLSYVSKIGTAGNGNDQFNMPRGVFIHDGFIYIADFGNNRIVKRLVSDLSYVAVVPINAPMSLCTDGVYLYVIAEVNHYRVYKYLLSDLSYTGQSFGIGTTTNDPTIGLNVAEGISTDGTYLYVGGSAGSFFIKLLSSNMSYVTHRNLGGAAGYYWDGSCTDGTYVWVSGRTNSHIVKINCSDLSTVWIYGTTGTGDNQFGGNSPRGNIGFDGTYLYAADIGNNRIKKHLASDGSYVSKIGTIGQGNDQFNYPWEIASSAFGLSAPSNVVCTPSSSGPLKNTITWDPVEGAVSYNIYWSLVSGTDKSGTEIVGAASPYQHTGLDRLVLPYYYVVTTVNSALAESAASAEVFGSPIDLLTGFGNIIS